MTPIGALRIVDIARSIVREVAPEQVAEFDFVAREFSPVAVRRACRPSNEPTASVTDLGQTVLGMVALGVTTDVCRYLIIESAKNAAKSGGGWFRRRFGRGKITLETEVPGLPAEQVELIRQRAVVAAVGYGLAADQAEALGLALVRSWSTPG